MSYYFRDKPKFGDRLRGKSGDELLQEIKQQFDEDSKSFFEPTTRSGRDPFERHSTFSRGFPFDDDGFGRRSDIRAHLDDLAARHPEFADHLLGPPWGDIPFRSGFRNRNRGSDNSGQSYHQQQGHSDEDTKSQASGSSGTSRASASSYGEPENPQNQHQDRQLQDTEQTSKKNQIPQYGLRNTVDIGQHHHNMENVDKGGNRGQRSMSAPPENRQSSSSHQPQEQQTQEPSGQRYVSRIDITPQHNQPPQPQQQSQQQQKSQQQSNVRHIPIFVEGRDEPVLPRSFDEPTRARREQSPTQFHTPPHFQRSSPFGDVFGARHQWSPHFQDNFYQQPSGFEHPSRRQQQSHSFQQPKKQQYAEKQPQQQHFEQSKQQNKHQTQSQQPQQQQQQQQQQHEPLKPKSNVPKDPLERVDLIQKEIDSLAEQVKQYIGNSRTDKQYIYLDEMLTRELIKLDDIETEGKDNVRQARKNAIRTIQETISLLESKAPLPSSQQQTPTSEQLEQDGQVSDNSEKTAQTSEPMHVDQKPLDQVFDDVEKAEQTKSKEIDQKVENQSKEAIPLPPCPSSESKQSEDTKEKESSIEKTNICGDQTENKQHEISQSISESMDTSSTTDKANPMDAQQSSENANVIEEPKIDSADEQKNTENVVEQKKSVKKTNKGKKGDTSDDQKLEENKADKQQSNQEQQQEEKEKIDVVAEVKQSPKSAKKGKKTKKQAAVSDKPIPLPAPEHTATSMK